MLHDHKIPVPSPLLPNASFPFNSPWPEGRSGARWQLSYPKHFWQFLLLYKYCSSPLPPFFMFPPKYNEIWREDYTGRSFYRPELSGTVLFVYCQSRRRCVALCCVYTTSLNTEKVSSGWVAVYLVHVLAGGARRCQVDKCCDCDVSCCDVIKFEVADV